MRRVLLNTLFYLSCYFLSRHFCLFLDIGNRDHVLCVIGKNAAGQYTDCKKNCNLRQDSYLFPFHNHQIQSPPEFPFFPASVLSRLSRASGSFFQDSLASFARRMRVAHKGNIFRTCEACAAASVLHSQEPLHRMEWRFIRHVGIRMIIHVWPTVFPVRQSFIAPFLLYLFFLLSCILKYSNILLFHGLCFCSRSR